MFFPYVESDYVRAREAGLLQGNDAQIVHCPDGAQYQIPEGPHTGRWVRCEDFDAYYAHMLRAEEYAGLSLTMEEQ